MKLKVRQNTLSVINMQCMVFSLPFPSEISDPGSGPRRLRISFCAIQVEKTVTLTNPCIWKIMITEGKEEANIRREVLLAVSRPNL